VTVDHRSYPVQGVSWCRGWGNCQFGVGAYIGDRRAQKQSQMVAGAQCDMELFRDRWAALGWIIQQ